MAEPEIVVASEIEDNPSHPEASNHESQVEGMHPNPGQLVQAIVADRGFISMLSSAILSNIGPQLNKSQDDSNINRAVSSPIQTVNPGVSDDQTGMLSNQINPGVSDDQMGSASVKRAAEVSADPEGEAIIPSKRPRGPNTFDDNAEENDVETVVIDDEFTSPNSRWEASEELSTFLGTTNKRMNKFDRKTLVKSYPRPDVDEVYTPAMDDFLKPFIQGIMAPDKPHKDLQDNILDMFGPLCSLAHFVPQTRICWQCWAALAVMG